MSRDLSPPLRTSMISRPLVRVGVPRWRTAQCAPSSGWDLSKDESKDLPFSETFRALGVEFSLTRQDEGIVLVANTPERKEELTSVIDGTLTSGQLDAKEAESLRSRLLFAEGQIFGRCAKAAVITVGIPRRPRPVVASFPKKPGSPWSGLRSESSMAGPGFQLSPPGRK